MKYLLCIFFDTKYSVGKVNDFNSIINEDIKEQKRATPTIQKTSQCASPGRKRKFSLVRKSAGNKKNRELIIVENAQKSYAAPSNENFLKFNKEIGEAKTQNQRKNQHRVAKELKELEQ